MDNQKAKFEGQSMQQTNEMEQKDKLREPHCIEGDIRCSGNISKGGKTVEILGFSSIFFLKPKIIGTENTCRFCVSMDVIW